MFKIGIEIYQILKEKDSNDKIKFVKKVNVILVRGNNIFIIFIIK